MGYLIDDILKLSQLIRAELSREQVDLSAIAQVIVEQLRQSEPHRHISFIIQAGLTVQGDPHLLESVLANLVSNAFKFTGKCAEAHIEFGQTELQGRHAFYVRDNGAGFDMKYSQKLFGAFQRMHTVSEFPGTGVGLASAQRVIHRHGGHVWAEAEVNRGATFYFTLNENGV
jgi:light-regulated signal transduction histidine kinase (bacteriophytochrome)